MQLPNSTNSLLFWLDPAEKFVYKNNNNQVTSILNRLDEKVIFSSVNQGPTWVDNSINGYSSLSFSGGQNLLFNLDTQGYITRSRAPFAITIVAKPSSLSPSQTILFSANKQNTTTSSPLGYILFDSNGVSTVKLDDSGNAAFIFNKPTDTNYHVYTSMYDGNYLVTRRDGIELGRTDASTLSISTLNQLCFGAYSPAISTILGGSKYFSGNIATALVYTTTASYIDFSYEDYLKSLYNI